MYFFYVRRASEREVQEGNTEYAEDNNKSAAAEGAAHKSLLCAICAFSYLTVATKPPLNNINVT